jgi:hypothetical protein
MTHLALVKTDVPAAPAPEKHKYSVYDATTIKGYQAMLQAGRYFRLFNAASPFPRIVSGNNYKEALPMSWLPADLGDYCKEHNRKRPSPMPSPDYIAAPLETVTGYIFRPKGPAMVRPKRLRHKYVNIYQEFEPEHPVIPLSMHFHRLFECLFPDPIERHTFLQYVAHMFQHPDIRPSWHVMLLSDTGTGKGFLYKAILRPLLCKQTALLKRYSELTGKFSMVMEGTILILLDDCKSKREDIQTQLKSLMSEDTVFLEPKGLQAGMVDTYSRFVLASNELVPLDLDHSTRRWWIPKRLGYANGLTGDAGRKQRKRQVIEPLADWIKLDGALEAMHQFFMEYDLTDFDPMSPPMTDTLYEQIANSVTVEQAFAADYLNHHATKVLKSGELCAAFTGVSMGKPSNQAIGKLFDDCEYRQDFLTVHGVKARWWFPTSMSKAEAECTANVPPEF